MPLFDFSALISEMILFWLSYENATQFLGSLLALPKRLHADPLYECEHQTVKQYCLDLFERFPIVSETMRTAHLHLIRERLERLHAIRSQKFSAQPSLLNSLFVSTPRKSVFTHEETLLQTLLFDYFEEQVSDVKNPHQVLNNIKVYQSKITVYERVENSNNSLIKLSEVFAFQLNLSRPNHLNEPWIHTVCRCGDTELLSLLLPLISTDELLAEDNGKNILLMIGIIHHQDNVVKMLINHNKIGLMVNRPILEFSFLQKNRNPADSISMMLSKHEKKWLLTPLMRAVFQNNRSDVQRLLSDQKNLIHQKNDDNQTAIDLAIEQRYIKIISILLKSGEIPQDQILKLFDHAISNQWSRSELIELNDLFSYVDEKHYPHFAKRFINELPDESVMDFIGFISQYAKDINPLNVAIVRAWNNLSHEPMKTLLSKNKWANTPDQNKLTPLVLALATGNQSIAKTVIEHPLINYDDSMKHMNEELESHLQMKGWSDLLEIVNTRKAETSLTSKPTFK